MKLRTLLFAGAVMVGMATTAQAQIWCNIQWPTPGNTVAGNGDLTVYSQIWLQDCTPGCGDLVGELYYRAEGETAFTGITMAYNTAAGNNDEYSGIIPQAALAGNTVDLYVRYIQFSTGDEFYANDGYNDDNPAVYYIEHAGTTVDFQYFVCVDTHCIDVDAAGIGVTGTFNGWADILPLCETTTDLWCGCIEIPAGTTPPSFSFKFRNGTEWENSIGDRTYTIATGQTCATGDYLWDDWDCVVASVDETPLEYTLSQNYPNPFNPSTTINFTLAETASVELTVFDLMGRKVATLAQGLTEAGDHSIEFNAENLSSGIYIYTLNAGDVQMSRRMVLVK